MYISKYLKSLVRDASGAFYLIQKPLFFLHIPMFFRTFASETAVSEMEVSEISN